MGLWRKLFPKTAAVISQAKKVCPTCGIEPSDLYYHPYCDTCWTKGRRERQLHEEARAREQRIEELTEALRRAFPNGPYGRG